MAAVVTQQRHVALIECLPSTQSIWLATVQRYGLPTLLGVVRDQNPLPIDRARDLGELGDWPQEVMH